MLKCNNLGILVRKKDDLNSSTINALPLIGIIDNNMIYKWIKYNKFEDTPMKIPKGFIKLNDNQYKNIIYTFCGKDKMQKIEHKNSKKYFIYSIGTAFKNELVFIDKNNIYIHTKIINTIDYYKYFQHFWKKKNLKYHFDYDEMSKSNMDEVLYNKKASYKIHNYDRVFIGKDLGVVNSILIQKNKKKYILICGQITEFNVCENDVIIKYISIYTHGRLYPDPIAIGKKNIYMPTFELYINKDKLPKHLKYMSNETFFYTLLELIQSNNIEFKKKRYSNTFYK